MNTTTTSQSAAPAHAAHAAAAAHSAPGSARTHSKTAWWKSARTKTIFKICVALAIVGLVIWWFWFYPYVSTDDARVAATMVRIAPQGTGGRVDKLNVSEGSVVKKGDILVELDHRAAEAQLIKAQAHAEVARQEFERAQKLFSGGGLPAREMDRARSESQTANAELTLAQVNLDNLILRSPIDGIVVQKNTEPGNILEPGQTAVTVADMNNAWIAANIEETSIKNVKLGQSVTISIDEGGELTGKVSEVRAAAASQFALIPSDNAAGNYTKLVQRIPIKVELDPHPGQALRVGQSVEIKIKVH